MKKQFVFTILCLYSFMIDSNTALASNEVGIFGVCSNYTRTNILQNVYIFQTPEVIYRKLDKKLCADWEITRNLQITYKYDKAKEIKEDGVFYHYDDENEVIEAQYYFSEGQVMVKALFWYDNVCHIISVICCKNNLNENKRVLKSLHEKIMNGQL